MMTSIDPKIKSMILNAISDRSSKKMYNDDDDEVNEDGSSSGKEVKKPAMKGVEIEIEAIGGKPKMGSSSSAKEEIRDAEDAATASEMESEEDGEKYKEIMEKMPGLTPDLIKKFVNVINENMMGGKQVNKYDNPMEVGMVGESRGRLSASSGGGGDDYNNKFKKSR